MISIKFAALQTAVNDSLEKILQEKGKEIIPTCKITKHFQTKPDVLFFSIFFLYYSAKFVIFVLLLKLKYI